MANIILMIMKYSHITPPTCANDMMTLFNETIDLIVHIPWPINGVLKKYNDDLVLLLLFRDNDNDGNSVIMIFINI